MGIWSTIAAGAASSLLGGLLGSGARTGRTETNQRMYTQANPFEYDAGLFGGSWKNGKGEITLSPEMQQIMDYGLLNNLYQTPQVMAEADALRQGFGSNLFSYNPAVAANQLYSQLSPPRERDFANQYLNLENRLFSQGRLGSSGSLSGQADLESLFRAQEAQRAQDMFKSYGLAQDTQRNLFDLYSASTMLPSTVMQSNLQPVLGIQEAAYAPMGLFGELAGSRGINTDNFRKYGPSAGYYAGIGLMRAGGNILGKGLTELFG